MDDPMLRPSSRGCRSLATERSGLRCVPGSGPLRGGALKRDLSGRARKCRLPCWAKTELAHRGRDDSRGPRRDRPGRILCDSRKSARRVSSNRDNGEDFDLSPVPAASTQLPHEVPIVGARDSRLQPLKLGVAWALVTVEGRLRDHEIAGQVGDCRHELARIAIWRVIQRGGRRPREGALAAVEHPSPLRVRDLVPVLDDVG
jgi:hypothetical protein